MKQCPECNETNWSRREFIRGVGAAVAGTGLVGLTPANRVVAGALTGKPTAETAVAELYTSLSADQKKAVCFAPDNKKRMRINANWNISEPEIEDYTKAQQELIHRALRGVCSEDGYKRFLKQMDDDNGGIGAYRVAIFGDPVNSKDFEWVMTGRHLTIRADGNMKDGTAFGGPIVYGHGVSSPAKNLFFYQTKKVNEVFGMLEGKQREKALLPKAPPESAVLITKGAEQFPGISMSEFSDDQKALVKGAMKTILAPYRKDDVAEAMHCLEEGGGMDKLSLAFYQDGDIGDDKIWDIWRIEGPTFVWHFRGKPHVHAYINVTTTPNIS